MSADPRPPAGEPSRVTPLLLLGLLLFLPGFLIALQRCWMRHGVEKADRFVETVVDFEEMRRLAREEGWSLPDLIQAMAKSGASSLGLSEDTLHSLADEGRIAVLDIQELQKLAVEGGMASFTPLTPKDAGALSIYSRDQILLNRIEEHLKLKLAPGKTERLAPQVLRIHKSSQDFRERVGLGFSPEYIGLAKEHQLGVVLRLFNFPGLDGDDLKRIIMNLPDPAQVSALVFAEEEVLGNRGNLQATVASLLLRPFRLGLIEFNDQGGMPFLVDRLRGHVPFVRVHSIGRKEMDEVYSKPRALARWIRAVRDRRLKMLYIRSFFQDKKKFIGDLVDFNLNYLASITERLQGEGFSIPRTNEERWEEPRTRLPAVAWYERLLMGTSLMSGLFLLVAVSRRSLSPGLLFSALVFLSLGAFLLLPTKSFAALAGIAGAIGFSTIGVLWAVSRLEDQGRRTYWWRGLAAFLGRLVLPSLVGGVLLAGFHAEADYLLKFAQFRGIKVAFLVPLLWVGIWSLRRYGGSMLSVLTVPLRFQDVIIGLVLVGGTALYLLRSGNVTFLKPSEWEDLFRTTLENLLVARPRNKEFLIGYPAVLFFAFFQFRGLKAILPVFLLFIEMGQVSLLNTFCHFHSPLSMAFIRGANGLWIGLLIGLAALFVWVVFRILALSSQKRNQGFLLGYFGFGNVGDEMLWRTFVDQARRARPDMNWILLHGTGDVEPPVEGVIPVNRSHWSDVLEQLVTSKVIVIPGGGVLQSATSVRSLLYYVVFLALGKTAGLRLLLPAQGLGPWARPSSEAFGFFPSLPGLAVGAVRLVLDLADFLSLRDQKSREYLDDLPDPLIPAEVSTDLAFALPVAAIGPDRPSPPAAPRIGVILRGGTEVTRSFAGAIHGLPAAERSRFLPIVLQPGEDDLAWITPPNPPVIPSTAASGETTLPELDILITMRLHGAILASLSGIPWIGVAYDPKLRGLAAELDWPYVVDPAEFSLSAVEKLLPEILARSGDLRKTLLGRAEEKHQRMLADLGACFSRLPREKT